MIFRFSVAILALFSVPLMAADQSDEFPLSNDTSTIKLEPNDVEAQNGIELSDWIESTFKGVSDNPVREHANKPIIRLASAPDSTAERRPWRSIEDPERAGVFPIQPVIINPRFKNSKFTNPEIVLNSDADCDEMHVTKPYLKGSDVAAHFDADCEMPGSVEENKDTKWTVILKLFPPGSPFQRTPFEHYGKYADFDDHNAEATFLCSKNGKWKVKAEFWVKVKGDWWWGTRLYLNNRSADITCPD